MVRLSAPPVKRLSEEWTESGNIVGMCVPGLIVCSLLAVTSRCLCPSSTLAVTCMLILLFRDKTGRKMMYITDVNNIGALSEGNSTNQIVWKRALMGTSLTCQGRVDVCSETLVRLWSCWVPESSHAILSDHPQKPTIPIFSLHDRTLVSPRLYHRPRCLSRCALPPSSLPP